MNRSNRTAIVLGSLIVVLLAVGGFLLLRSPERPGVDVAGGGNETPSEVASDSTAGGADEAGDATASPSPSEVGRDAAAGGANGGATKTEEPRNGDGAGAGGDGGAGASGDGNGGDGAGGNGGRGGDGGDGDGDGDDDQQLAGDIEEDTRDAGADGDLPKTGGGALLAGLMLLAAGIALRPRR